MTRFSPLRPQPYAPSPSSLSIALSSRPFSVSRGIVRLAHTIIVGRGDLSDRVVEVCHFPPFPAAATGARRGRGLGGRGLRARRAGRPAGAVFPRKSANESSFHAESRPANVVPLQHTRAPLQAPPSWEKSEPQRSLAGGSPPDPARGFSRWNEGNPGGFQRGFHQSKAQRTAQTLACSVAPPF